MIIQKSEIRGIILDKDQPLKWAVQEVEKAFIQEALILTRGNITKAAKLLGINRGTVLNKLKVIKQDHKLKQVAA